MEPKQLYFYSFVGMFAILTGMFVAALMGLLIDNRQRCRLERVMVCLEEELSLRHSSVSAAEKRPGKVRKT